MKKLSFFFRKILSFSLLLFLIFFPGCSKKSDNPVKFPSGIFPDTVINMGRINSPYDDYNLALYMLTGTSPVVFSSNRNSAGGQFDLVQGNIAFTFDQTNGNFELTTSISNDAFLNSLISKATTPGNDFGPYRFFSTDDGYEYLILSSVNSQGDLDLYFLRNMPYFGGSLPEVQGPVNVSIMNSDSDDAYFSFDTNQDTAYFCSSRGGNFDIYMLSKPVNIETGQWLIQNPGQVIKVDSVNSTSDDKCPLVTRNIMVFASNRPGGLGGYDLYYSKLKNGKWSLPVNFGPRINTASNEYRPVLGWQEGFSNYFMMFSSDRPGGEGGFDLYFTGIEFD